MTEIGIDQYDLLEWFLNEHQQNNPNPSFPVNQEKKMDLLRTLYYLLPNQEKLLEAAVEILDLASASESMSAIQEYELASINGTRRCFWKVAGSSRSREHLCLQHYCNCRSFSLLSRGPSSKILCKHILAVQIAKCIGLVEKKTEGNSAGEDFFLVLGRLMKNSTSSSSLYKR